MTLDGWQGLGVTCQAVAKTLARARETVVGQVEAAVQKPRHLEGGPGVDPGFVASQLDVSISACSETVAGGRDGDGGDAGAPSAPDGAAAARAGRAVRVETRNRYEVVSEGGAPLAYAAEQQKGFLESCSGSRSATGGRSISVLTPDRVPLTTARHPFRWFFQRLEVYDEGGGFVGAIQRASRS